MEASDGNGLSAARSSRAYFVYALAAAFLCYEMALQVSPSVMTVHLMRDFNIDAAGLGLMSGFYFYSYTLMQIPAGLLFDRYSSRWLITIALLVCVAGAFFFGGTATAFLAGMGRFFMGLGSAFAFIGVLVVAARWFAPTYFAFLVGVAQFLAAMGAMSGEAPLAAAVDHYGWRPTTLTVAYIGLILAVVIFLVVRDNPQDFELNGSTSSKPMAIGASVRSILGNSQTWWLGLYAFASWAPITAFASLWGVPFIMSRYGVSSTLAGEAIAMIWIGLGISSPLLGWLSDQLGRRCVLLNFCALVGLVSSLVILYSPTVPFMLLFLLLFGFGIATSGQILSFAVVRDINRHEVTATAIGVNNMAVVAGGAVFQPLIGYMLHWQWGGKMVNGTPFYTVQNYQYALAVVPLCFFISWVASQFFIRETYCKPTYPTNA